MLYEIKEKKIGRNDPCPCGSGLKHKKCHGRGITTLPMKSDTVDQKLFVNLPPHIQQKIIEREIKDKSWKAQYGEVRQTISLDFQGHKMIAVGNQVHLSKKWKTFHDFLCDYIKICLGSEWGNLELQKDYIDRHPIIQWYKALCDFQRRNFKEEGAIHSAESTGPVGAYLSLAYDLYVLRHHSLLQDLLIQRLRNKKQFQGARYELFVTASFIKAGFNINFEDEADRTKSHCEFVATHKASGKRYSVEAKSRHRPGYLGQDGDPRGNDDIRLRIGNLLRDALKKDAMHTRIVFIDINMPPRNNSVKPFQATWFKSLINEVSKVETDGIGSSPIPPAYLFFTNHPYHYVGDEQPEPKKDFIITAINMALWKINAPEVVMKTDLPIFILWKSINEHSKVPSAFDK